MRVARWLVLLLVLPLPASAATAEDAEDWRLIGGVLALVQQIVHLAAHSPDPQAAQKSVDAILAGQDVRANRIAARVMDEAMQDVPAEQRGVFLAIGRDLLALARREQSRSTVAAPLEAEAARNAAIQARRDLHAMGLRYWDERQYAEALRRGDRIAVDLFNAAQGLPSSVLPRNPPPTR
jgi:hypothetical protein